MGEADHFSVTVSRVNESANVDPYITINGHSLTVSSDGSLHVVGQHGSRSFSAGLWDGFEVRRLLSKRS
jgi:hypothetical protein